MKELRSDFAALQNRLSPEEIQVILELRKIEWGKLSVTVKNGKITVISPAPEYRMNS